MNRWSVEHVTGTAGELHQLDVDWSHVPCGWNHVTAPAIVLGSAQVRADVIDEGSPHRRGFEVVTWRSGGGVVLLAPGDHVWLDVVIPRDDPLWDDDVSRAGWWLGEAWASAITALARQPGVDHVDIHRRGVSDPAVGRLARFAALGPGEVVIDGRKAVGVSQRRNRGGGVFQCTAMTTWDPQATLLVIRPELVTRDLVEALTDRVVALEPWWGEVGDLVTDALAPCRLATTEISGPLDLASERLFLNLVAARALTWPFAVRDARTGVRQPRKIPKTAWGMPLLGGGEWLMVGQSGVLGRD